MLLLLAGCAPKTAVDTAAPGDAVTHDTGRVDTGGAGDAVWIVYAWDGEHLAGAIWPPLR